MERAREATKAREEAPVSKMFLGRPAFYVEVYACSPGRCEAASRTVFLSQLFTPNPSNLDPVNPQSPKT